MPTKFRRRFLPPRCAKPKRQNPRRLQGREDWRDVPLVTIDPPDAKDHDDAVHAEADPDPNNKGGFILNVAIADVAFYVRPGSALDRDALTRGNSVYFPDRVVPMLPERISNDLCSLVPGEPRGALAVRMVIGADGRKRSHTFHRILMRSAAKLSYAQAQAAIDGRPDDITGPLLDPILKPLYAAYACVKLARDERSPLDLDLPERKILLKPDGTVDRVIVPERLDAHKLIEEFMILANVAAAEMLEKKALPLIYRVHDEPTLEKVHNLQEFLKTLDLPFAKSGALRPALFNRVLAQVKGHDSEPLVNEVVLRSQAQAEYSAENYGHFGLNLRRYAHFTSPIRRYADLVVHRALIRGLGLGEGALPPDRDDGILERSRGADFRHRAPRHEGRARNRRPADRAFPRRPHRRDVSGPDFRRHPRRTVRQTQRHRRRRADPDPHARHRIFQLRRGAPCAGRLAQRCHAPAGGRGRCASGRSGSGGGRVAVRTAVGRPRDPARTPGASSRVATESSAAGTGQSPSGPQPAQERPQAGQSQSRQIERGKSWKP